MVALKLKGYFISGITVGIVIIMLLMAAGAYKINSVLEESRIAQATAITANIAAAISQYKLEIGEYPLKLENLTEKKDNFGPWIKEIKKDAWKNEYIYQFNDDGYVIYSHGVNGRPDGSSFNGIANGDIGCIGK